MSKQLDQLLSDYEDGDNLILLDKESGNRLILYGHELYRQFMQRKITQPIFTLSVPAEAYVALLQVYFAELPEVRDYLFQIESGGGVNPSEGVALEAVSNAIWLEKRHLQILLESVEHIEEQDRG